MPIITFSPIAYFGDHPLHTFLLYPPGCFVAADGRKSVHKEFFTLKDLALCAILIGNNYWYAFRKMQEKL